jgi:outer membrane protein assembly factor BamB
VLGAGGYLASRSGWVRRLFADDVVNPAELERLGGRQLAPPTAEQTAGWPQWRGPNRDGRAAPGLLRTDWDKAPPKQLWTAPCGGGYSSLAVVGGRVYTQDRQAGQERVFCLDVADGKLLWEYVYPADYTQMDPTYAVGPRATPTVEGNRVYTVGAVGKLLCLEPPAGPGPPRVVWEHDLAAEFPGSVPQWGVACSPLVEGDLVIVQPGGKNGAVAAFDKTTGEKRWTTGTDPPGYSSPITATVGGTRLVYTFTGDSLLCVRPTDGAVLDRYPWPTQFKGNIATPVVVDDYVFISSAYSMGCALLRAVPSGDKVKLERVYDFRRRPPLQTHHSSAVYADGFLYGFDNDRLRCVDFRTGKANDDWEARQLDKGSVILVGKHLVVLTQSGAIALVDATAEEFRLVGHVPKVLNGRNNWSAPALADGRLFLRDDEKVLSLDVVRE